MRTLEFSLRAIKDAQQSTKEDAFDVLVDGALKYEHVSAVESALDGSFEATATFQFEIKGTLGVQLSCT